jgi:hypothetical protein
MVKKNLLRLPLLLCFFLQFTSWGWGQQNLFNIPSGDITPKNKWFFQQQINFYQPWELEVKNHFVYGLGGDFEVGVNVINLPFNFKSKPMMPFNLNPDSTSVSLSPLVLFTAQKNISITPKASIVLGAQMGFNISDKVNRMRYAHLSFALFVWKPFDKLKLISGVYVANRYKAGAGASVGFMGGFEYHVHNKWILMGDFISGTHSLGTSVWGVTYNVTNRFQLCLGGLIPNPGSVNKPGIVLEINILGFDTDGHAHSKKRRKK